MKKELEKIFSEIDSLLTAGKTREAKLQFQSFALRHVPRKDRVRYAELARRLNLGHHAIKALYPYVRPSGKIAVTATAAERVEYGGALWRVGASEEAVAVFETVDPKEHWNVLLLEAYALFSQWRYHEAIPLLERYVKGSELTEYQRLIGEVNLASALIYEHHPRSAYLLENVMAKACSQNHRNLYGYALKLSAEYAIWQKNWKEARKQILLAQEVYKGTDSLDALYTRKWEGILNVYCDPSQKNIEELQKISQESIHRRNWETPRSIDYHLALALKNEEILKRVLFGTPFETFKERLKLDFGLTNNLSSYEWVLKGQGKDSHIFSMEQLRHEKNAPRFGGTLYRTIETLTLDFYRPFRASEIHSRVLKGEYYNPSTSAHRVAQIVNRIRNHWKSVRSPMLIIEENGEYRLGCQEACIVKISTSDRKIRDTNQLQMETLRNHFSSLPFDTNQAEKILGLPKWTTQRILKWGIDSGKLTRKGNTKAIRYEFLPLSKEKKAA